MPLSMNEYQVLMLLHHGAAEPTTVAEIARVTQLEERGIRDIISNLILQYGVPIVAMRHGNTGMFIATDDNERNMGITSYKSQVKTMHTRLAAIEHADLNGWEQALRPDIKRLIAPIMREANNDTAS